MFELVLLLSLATPQADAQAEPEEIVVTATRGKCRLRIADRMLSDPEFKARAAEWAQGKPVRVVVPTSSSYRCMAKIAFRLSDHGVRLIHWVYPNEQ